MAQPVEFAGGDARLDEGRDVVEDLGGQPAGYPHLGDVVGVLDMDAHAARKSGGEATGCALIRI
ncbi:hypothetical protein ACU4GI_29175 [Cupriavidus basilensis]